MQRNDELSRTDDPLRDERYRRDYEREGRVESPPERASVRPIWGNGYYGAGDPRNVPIHSYVTFRERDELTDEQRLAGHDGLVDTTAHPVGGRVVGKGPRGYVRSDDRIREDVCAVLTDDAVVDASDVEVNVHDGEVTLEGSVESRHAKIWAERLTMHVPGVRDVRNLLHVRTLDLWDWEPLNVAGEPIPNRIK